MIFLGTGSRRLVSEVLMENCPHCGKNYSLTLHIYQQYAHVFWIPFAPMKKTGVTECQHCKQVLTAKQMPGDIRNSYEIWKKQVKTPKWLFSGLALLAVLIVVIIISNKRNDALNQEMILSPHKGDVFEIKINDRLYTLYKVQKVTGDSVFVIMHEYQTDRVSGLYDLKAKRSVDYNETVTISFAIPELKRMLDRGTIVDIHRDP